MSLSLLNNRISLSTFRGLINAIVTACNTNTTNIDTNTSNIATNTSNISALQTSKQNANAVSTVRYDYDTTLTGSHTLLGTEENKMFDITNTGASTFTFPQTGTIPQFVLGATVIIINNSASTNNIVLTAGGGVTLVTGNLSTTLTPGDRAWVVRSGTNRYTRVF